MLRNSNRCVRLTGIDRDLFEALIERSRFGCHGGRSDRSRLVGDGAPPRMLLSAYQDLDLAGAVLDVDSLLLLIENEQLKNVVVTLQERQQAACRKVARDSPNNDMLRS